MAVPTNPLRGIFKARGKRLDLSGPRIMGILNITPDSFSDGGLFLDTAAAVQRASEMAAQGAALIDIGGESTRPGSDPVSPEEELKRIRPVVREVRRELPDIMISVDTQKMAVAREALELGADLINDISGLQKNPEIARLCAKYDAGLIIMHSKGDPKTMQVNPEYEDVVAEIETFLKRQTDLAKAAGATNLIVDPGIGFGKTLEHNLQLLVHLTRFAELGYPLLIGASRKSMIHALLGERPPDQRLPATLALHYEAMIQGARILRVHDVKEAMDTIRVFEAIRSHE